MKEYNGIHTCIRNIGKFEEGKQYHRHIDCGGTTTMITDDGTKHIVADELYEEHFLFASEYEIAKHYGDNNK